MKLISMTDFVLETVQTPNINEAICLEQTQERLDKIYRYSLFLKQPLELWMIVPCDEDGNVLIEPTPEKYELSTIDGDEQFDQDIEEYQKAKERCLFDVEINRFEFDGTIFNTIEFNRVRVAYKFDDSRKGKITEGKWSFYENYTTIEDLVGLEPTLSTTAINQIK